MFKNRIEAAGTLARQLQRFALMPGVILAVPRGGIPIGAVIAGKTGLPLDLLMTKKIGHPQNREYAIGAVGLADSYILPHKGVSPGYIKAETEALRKRLAEMRRKFMGGSRPLPLKDRIVIVVDDGAATGNTLLSAIQILRREEPGRIVVAIPVASTPAARKLRAAADELICPLVVDDFAGVGDYYEDFQQVSDEEALHYLRQLRTSPGAPIDNQPNHRANHAHR
ncbi:MAG TPA: phosphoribosyltransferase family protein [Puia sp.]|nr:phosphoribosyltransferase family protein [Puia sp.]